MKKEEIREFFYNVFGWNEHDEGYLEVVVNYRNSQYYSKNEIDDAIEYALESSQEGSEVHYGPALRKESLNKRSSIKNVLKCRVIFLDLDSPDKSLPVKNQVQVIQEIIKTKFLTLKKSFQIEPTYMVKSGHGLHFYFVLNAYYEFPNEQVEFIKQMLIDYTESDPAVKDAPRLMRFPGTKNYKDEKRPVDVAILNKTDMKYDLNDFMEFASKHQKVVEENRATKKKKSKSVKNVKKTKKKTIHCPPCLKKLLDKNYQPPLGFRHHVRLVATTWCFHNGISEEICIKLLMHTTDDPDKAESNIRSIYKSLNENKNRYKVGCGEGSLLRSLIDSGISECNEEDCFYIKQKQEDKKEKAYIAWFKGLVDIVISEKNELSFLIQNNGKLSLETETEYEGKKCFPPPEKGLGYLIPRQDQVFKHYEKDNDIKLFKDLTAYLQRVSEMPTNDYYQFLAAYIMFSYVCHDFNYCPIIWFYGLPERGKSRTGKAMLYCCFRGIHLIQLNEAHIIRLATNNRAVLFFDMTDIQSHMIRYGFTDVVLGRFEKGVKVPKVLNYQKGAFEDIVYFEVYGPTIIATNEIINDIFRTRAIEIVMPQSTRVFNNEVTPESGLPYRERLVAFRARWMNRKIVDADIPFKGRLGDMLRPMLKMILTIGLEDAWFYDFGSRIQDEKVIAQKDSIEAQMVTALVNVHGRLRNEIILIQDIYQELNEHMQEGHEISRHKVGMILSKLNFKRHNNGKQRGVVWDEREIRALCDRFGVEM